MKRQISATSIYRHDNKNSNGLYEVFYSVLQSSTIFTGKKGLETLVPSLCSLDPTDCAGSSTLQGVRDTSQTSGCCLSQQFLLLLSNCGTSIFILSNLQVPLINTYRYRWYSLSSPFPRVALFFYYINYLYYWKSVSITGLLSMT